MGFKDYRDVIRQMEREMQQLTDEAFRGLFAMPVGGAGRFWQPNVDIHETDSQLIVKLELAGVPSDRLQVVLSSDDRVLMITGTRGEEAVDRNGRVRCHQLEIYFGPFERAIALPRDIQLDREKITASYRDGFLQIMLPKRLAAADRPQKRIIPITHNENTESHSESEGE